MVEGNVAKCGQDPCPRDRIWGIGLGAANERATDPAMWRGRNLLGFAPMEARERLSRA